MAHGVRLTLPANTVFATDDPDALADDLRTEHRDVRDECKSIDAAKPDRWTVVYVPEGGVARAQRDIALSCAGTLTVFTPGNPKPGDCFRVISAGLSNVTVASDDGKNIQGVATADIWLATGWREYQYVTAPLDARLSGWWRNA